MPFGRQAQGLIRNCLLLAILALFLSCGGLDPSGSRNSGGGTETLGNSNPSGNFKNDLLTISLVAPGEESGRFYDLTPGHVSDSQRNAVIARLSRARKEAVSPRHADDATHLLQFTIHQENTGFGAHFVYLLDTLEGTSQPFVAYTPEIFIGRSPHNGVTTPLPILEPGNNLIVYRWTVNDSSEPLDVALQPTTLTKPEFAFQTLTPTGSDEVTLIFNLNRIGDASSAQVQGEVTLNGQYLATIDSTTNPDLANLLPLFRCTRSGHYHLTMTHNGVVEVDEDYVQRSLAWETPWPSIENGDVNSPITFTNRLVWKVGEEVLPTEADQPRWRARFPGDSFPRPTAGQEQPYQPGSQLSFTWDPSSLEVSARGAADGRFRLVPSDAGVEESGLAGQRREDVQAREPQTTYTYSVEADAVTFERFSPLLRQRVNASGLVPAKVRQVYMGACPKRCAIGPVLSKVY